MKTVTPSLFKEIVQRTAGEQALLTGKGFGIELDDFKAVRNGHTFKVVKAVLYRAKDTAVRVDFMMGLASIYIYCGSTERYLPGEWGPIDLVELTRAIDLAGKILDQLNKEKGR